MSTRVSIVLPDEVLAELDQIAGKRHRSEFIAEAIREKLNLARRTRAVRETVAILPGDEIPVWHSAEEVSAWLRASRQRDVERLTPQEHTSA
ncbi:MAG TPA: ribbon-helix-helix domain-containing protein [Thermomicrobiales bacterium]|nr:ribbon-helix-helix domain-containing protein [Thermomicrobiales bacterium]